jgi:hypothetical protein
VMIALRLAAHRSVGGGPCPTSRRHCVAPSRRRWP